MSRIIKITYHSPKPISLLTISFLGSRNIHPVILSWICRKPRHRDICAIFNEDSVGVRVTIPLTRPSTYHIPLGKQKCSSDNLQWIYNMLRHRDIFAILNKEFVGLRVWEAVLRREFFLHCCGA